MRTTADLTDEALAARASEGDADAFGVLLDRHAQGARRVALTILGNGQDAEDAVQDGALAAWRAGTRFDTRRAFRPWFYRIVLNAARDLRRRRGVRRTEPVSPVEPSKVAGPDRMADRALLRQRLREALATLPERQRVAVTLYDGEGMSHREIAALLDAPEGTVRSDVFHGRRALREQLATLREELGDVGQSI